MKKLKTPEQEVTFRSTCQLAIGRSAASPHDLRVAADGLDKATRAYHTGEEIVGFSYYTTAASLRNLATKLETEDTEILNRIADADTEAAEHKASYLSLLEDYKDLRKELSDADSEIGASDGTIAFLRECANVDDAAIQQQVVTIERQAKSIAELASKNNALTDDLRRERKHYDIMIEVLLRASEALNTKDEEVDVRFVFTTEDGGLTPEEASELALNIADDPEAFETL